MAEQPTVTDTPEQPSQPRRRVGAIIAIVLLTLALIATAVVLVLFMLELEAANEQIRDQNREITEQEELIDKKETFGVAMEALLDTASEFNGVQLGSIVDQSEFELLAIRGWSHRWDLNAMSRDIDSVDEASAELRAVLDAAAVEASTNTTGTVYETVIDQLGGGHVASVFNAADAYCEEDVIACVGSEDPQTVHFDTGDSALPYMNDTLRTGIAYHEYAHVLQFTNQDETETAVEAFGGDFETMADCYALTYLPGWKLDHQIFTSRYEYWDVSLGYGLTCDETHRQAIRTWIDSLGIEVLPVTQDR